jgi:hypothetical protein
MTTGKEPLPKVTSSGTQTPGQVSAKAAAAATALIPSSIAAAKSSIIQGVSQGIDPTTGKPIVQKIYPAGYEQNYIKNLPPQDRIALQKKMLGLNLYPKGFSPTLDGMVTKEDFNAIQNLMAVGEQRAIGDIDAVINLAKKDSKVRSFLQTGGYTPTAPKVSYTNPSESKAVLTDNFLSIFNDKPTPAEITEFQTILKNKEKAAKGGITSLEVNDIILSVANKRITGAAKLAVTGDAKAKDVLDSGLLGRRVREIKAKYYDNGIPVSDATVYKQASASIRNQDAYDNVLDEINQNAITQWGKLGLQLKPGQTIKRVLQPYISLRSQIRGIPEESIDISTMTDVLDESGNPISFNKFKMKEYGSKEYLESDSFKATTMNDTQAVLRNFGVL